jgi:hypothetical protein
MRCTRTNFPGDGVGAGGLPRRIPNASGRLRASSTATCRAGNTRLSSTGRPACRTLQPRRWRRERATRQWQERSASLAQTSLRLAELATEVFPLGLWRRTIQGRNPANLFHEIFDRFEVVVNKRPRPVTPGGMFLTTSQPSCPSAGLSVCQCRRRGSCPCARSMRVSSPQPIALHCEHSLSRKVLHGAVQVCCVACMRAWQPDHGCHRRGGDNLHRQEPLVYWCIESDCCVSGVDEMVKRKHKVTPTDDVEGRWKLAETLGRSRAHYAIAC